TNYKIRVVTADKFGAGTDGNVYIRLKGTAGDTGNIGLPGRFDHNSTEDKNMFLPDVGTIISVDIGDVLLHTRWKEEFLRDTEDRGSIVSIRSSNV
ncbi:hypothetical protein DPMN_160260, partial [Dreissena polymorpha]